MRVNGSKTGACRTILPAIIVTYLALLSGALPAQNRVFAWGNNSWLQLGTTPPNWTDGTNTHNGRNVPAYIRAFTTQLPAPGNSTAAIASGDFHTLALKTDGTVWAWGDNGFGQLGGGSYANNSDRPVQAGLQVGLTGVIAIAAGGDHSMALKSDGTVWAWGDNGYGESGNGNVGASFSIPQQVTGFPTDTATGLPMKVKAIAAGSAHSMALLADNTVCAWGNDGDGQLGDGARNSLSVPARIVQLSGVTTIGADGNSSLAITGSGAVWVWGRVNTNVPARVPGLSGVTAFSLDGLAGDAWTSHFSAPLLVKSDGTLWYLSSSGGLQATQIAGVSNVSAVSGNDNFVITLHKDGTVWCRGDNSDGQMGNALALNTQWNWIQATGISSAGQVQAGGRHAVALDKTTGKLWSWGDNQDGQSAMPSPQHQSRPTRPHVAFGSVAAATVGSEGGYAAYYLFLHKDGTVWSWGSNAYGQLGDGSTTDSYATTTQVANLSGAVQVAASRYAANFAIKSDGTLWAWGYNVNSQLGDGTTTERDSVIQVTGLIGVVKAVAPGTYHTLALMNDGTVWAWGDNALGEVGDGTTTNRASPVQVSGLADVVAIAAGDYFSLALKKDGSVWAWGYNGSGQLGDTSHNQSSPVPVSGLPYVTAIAAGTSHCMALTTQGTVYCWGHNYTGELGNGTTTNTRIPQQVPGLIGVRAISAGTDYFGQSFAIRSDNTAWAWGNDYYGQLGDGIMTPTGIRIGVLAQPNPAQVFLPGVRSIVSCGGVTLGLVKDIEPDMRGVGDGNSDLLLQDTVTGAQQLWYMNGMALNQKVNFGAGISQNWTLGGIADLNGDGFLDLLWQKSAASPLNPGQINGWLMNGASPPTYDHVYSHTPAGWNLAGLADINNDGSPDMIWQAPDQRVKAIYLSGGVLTGGGSLLVTLPAGWRVAGTADMDGDGWPDIIAQNSATGAVRVWYLKGNVWTGATDDLAPGQSGWRLASIQDMDGDSNPDFIWQLSNGNVMAWQMDDIVGYTGQLYPISSGLTVGQNIARAH